MLQLLYSIPLVNIWGEFVTLKAELDTKKGVIRIREIDEFGNDGLPFCPTGYPAVIFVGKTKTSLRKAIELANAVASINTLCVIK